MNRSFRTHSMRRRLALALALLILPIVLTASQRPAAQAANPCASLPSACHYTYDARENCCVADPRFDCYDICF